MRRTKKDALETRTAIMDAAERLFHAQGVANTSLAEIASEANVTRGAIYWHFSGKSALFAAMSDRVTLPEEAFFRERAKGESGDTLDGLKALNLELVRRFTADPHAQRVHEILMFRCEYVGEMDAVMQRRRDVEDAFSRSLVEALSRVAEDSGMGQGWTPDLAAAILRCAMLGALSDWIRRGRDFDLLPVVSVLLDSVFGSFRRDLPDATISAPAT